VLNGFLERKGIWPAGVTIPDELFAEARQLLTGLVESGTISGFKDPRTVLTWPFWRQVLSEFRSLRVVVVPLLRSPHEIAVSLCVRSQGAYSYWTSLDLVDVHFRRLQAIMESEAQVSNVVRFGSPGFHDDLAAAARFCGLTWNEADALQVFDRDCVHHEPATVYHEAQAVYEALGGARPPASEAERMGWLQARDVRRCEALTHRLALAGIETLKQFEAMKARLSQAEAALARTQAALARTQAALARTQAALTDAKEQLVRGCSEMLRAQESERRLSEECQRLRAQRDRFESHPVLGPLLRSRRRLKGVLR
ncbi:MAG: hypothetical protein ACP5XB_28110, partial [Isosphaeraceae bacterium]